jgi:sec-independent protein translocase protein TatB
MWNIGFGELAIICIVLIIAVGPERLPSMMKTVGKTVRTLRQASRDLRESTGIDELLREDFDYHPPPRRPVAPVGPAIARDAEPVAVMNPATAPLEPVGAPQDAAEALPSDGPLTAEVTAPTADVPASPNAQPAAGDTDLLEHANVSGTLPSDAPLAATAPPISAPPPAGPLSVPPPVNDDAKSRES